MLPSLKHLLVKCLLTTLFAIVGHKVSGQTAIQKKVQDPSNRISGMVRDTETKEPLAFATVVIFQEGLFVAGRSVDEMGAFSFTQIPQGKYEMLVRFAGYDDFTFDFQYNPGKGLTVEIALREIQDFIDPPKLFGPKVPHLDINQTTYTREQIEERGR